MNKIVHPVIVFLVFKIAWKKLLLIGAVITITFALFQLKTLPDQLTTPDSSHLDTYHFDVNLKRQITPLTIDKPSEVIKIDHEPTMLNSSSQFIKIDHETAMLNSSTQSIKIDHETAMLNSSSHSIQSIAVVQQKVIVTQNRNQMDINKSTKSMPPSSFSSSSERRRKRHMRDIKALSPYEALVYAKKELDTISVGVDDHDPNLYAPLFRNVTVFERSYELMELILKVFVYPDGKRPIFHTPYLRGIYSSEGWFMKFMESSKQFVTHDPQKAHLFYLPYSARQLQRALYVPDSHNIKPLSIFLKDYVKKIASKYPFWNRTRGSDHFLVACHDWGPYTLKEHKELNKNTIKALCNADTSEGVFIAGKDVSLPETTIGNPRRPVRNMGGKRISQRPILAFFAGEMHGRVRPTLIKYWANKHKNMIISGPMSYKTSQTMSYSLHMKSSKYCICPMGFEVNSPRIVEAIYYECVPVIIADNFVPPLNEVLNWSAFSVNVAEHDIPKLKEILEAISMKRYRMMQNNVKMLQRHFYWNRTPVKYDMFHMILHSIWLSRLNQIQDLTGTQ